MGVLDNRRKIHWKLRNCHNVFIMGHANLDLDALGSCMGVYRIAKFFRKNVYIIIDDVDNELGVKKVLKEIESSYNLIKTEDIPNYMDKNRNKNLLIIVDVNKPYMVQSAQALELFDKKIVLDHHEMDDTSISNGLIIVDTSASSASEMICSLIKADRIEVSPYVATILLSGMVLDTNNFTLKTKASTYFYAYHLTSLGASPREVQYLLKQDIDQYIKRQKPITNVRIVNKNMAVTTGVGNSIYRREDLARIADTLIMFNGIEASFVIGKLDKSTVGISARSLGTIEVNKILSKLSGGGDKYNAASKISNFTVKEVEAQLNKLLEEDI